MAHALIAEHGADVPMEEVARRAGVGTGTLYRRFPNRDALIRGVALDSFHRVIAIARTADLTQAGVDRHLALMLDGLRAPAPPLCPLRRSLSPI